MGLISHYGPGHVKLETRKVYVVRMTRNMSWHFTHIHGEQTCLPLGRYSLYRWWPHIQVPSPSVHLSSQSDGMLILLASKHCSLCVLHGSRLCDDHSLWVIRHLCDLLSLIGTYEGIVTIARVCAQGSVLGVVSDLPRPRLIPLRLLPVGPYAVARKLCTTEFEPKLPNHDLCPGD